jgi:hypothetical protein
MLFKIVKGEVAINASDFLDKPARATRAKHGHKFNTIRANTNEYKFSFFVRNIPAWNGLDCEVVSCSKSGQFKCKLTSIFLYPTASAQHHLYPGMYSLFKEVVLYSTRTRFLGYD